MRLSVGSCCSLLFRTLVNSVTFAPMGNMCCAGPITDNFFEAVSTTPCCVAAGTEDHCAAPIPPPSQVMETAGLVWVLPHKTENLRKIYTLRRKLGRGSYGTTRLCVEKATGKKYACKSITKKELGTDEVEYVRREIGIMHYLSGRHPNIISIKGAYEDDTAVHVVMELCTGGELLDRVIIKEKHYSERRAAEMARVIVDVVAACHSLGVMHRDLKPENFLFASKNKKAAELVAIDFGYSVFFRPGDVFTDVVGSLHYAAPEVLCERHGPEADVWSAGVIIYMLLTGSKPFSGKTIEMYEEAMNGTLDLESKPWPRISESAKDLVRKMLAKDPRNRLTAHQALCHPWLSSA